MADVPDNGTWAAVARAQRVARREARTKAAAGETVLAALLWAAQNRRWTADVPICQRCQRGLCFIRRGREEMANQQGDVSQQDRADRGHHDGDVRSEMD